MTASGRGERPWRRAWPLERPAVRLVWWWLVRRGWAVQLNTPDRCHDVYEEGGRRYDRGWRPYFSVRYGHRAVYRGPAEVRWPPGLEERVP